MIRITVTHPIVNIQQITDCLTYLNDNYGKGKIYPNSVTAWRSDKGAVSGMYYQQIPKYGKLVKITWRLVGESIRALGHQRSIYKGR